MMSITQPKILITEDNPINQRIANLTLKKMGLTCDIASNGFEAIEMYKKSSYDIIFMDLQMPEMDGLEASKKIRDYEKESKIVKPVFIVAITANTSEKKQICIESGMNDFIEKPIREQLIKEIILKIQ